MMVNDMMITFHGDGDLGELSSVVCSVNLVDFCNISFNTMYLYNYLLSALGLNSIPGSCLLESEFTGVLGNVNLMGFLTLNVVSVSKEISFLVSWHE